jgi:hypothetical protein
VPPYEQAIAMMAFGGDLSNTIDGPIDDRGAQYRDWMHTLDHGGNVPNHPTYEAEDNEIAIGQKPQVANGGEMTKIADGVHRFDGNTHAEGGIEASKGKYIFSDKLKLSKSFLKGI